MATKRFRVVETSSKARQAEPAALTPLLSIGTCAVFLAFAGLWLIFFRNIAALPSELMFWHFHFIVALAMEPPATAAIVLRGIRESDMSHWRNSTARADVMRGTGEDEATYAAGWAIIGLATLATILVWVFAI